MATQTRFIDPSRVRLLYEGMSTSALCNVLVGLASMAAHASTRGGTENLASAIDSAAIAIDVLSSRLPDVGTEGGDRTDYELLGRVERKLER